MSPLLSALPAFFASLVEFVEALTIVLAVGVSINWKSSLGGALGAVLVLGALVAGLGTSLVLWVPLDILRLVVGLILVLFGLQWLRKSLLRSSGLKALHDEGLLFQKHREALEAEGGPSQGWNPGGIVTSFKGVFLEGLEVVFIVITFGTSAGTDKGVGLQVAGLGAGAAFLVVLVLGLMLRKPLTLVPENTLKAGVGLLLVSFGVFWAGEGWGIPWPGAEGSLVVLVALGLVATGAGVAWLKTRSLRGLPDPQPPRGWGRWAWEVFDFVCGDGWVLGGVAVTGALVGGLGAGAPGLVPGPVLAVVWVLGVWASLGWSLSRQTQATPRPSPTAGPPGGGGPAHGPPQ